MRLERENKSSMTCYNHSRDVPAGPGHVYTTVLGCTTSPARGAVGSHAALWRHGLPRKAAPWPAQRPDARSSARLRSAMPSTSASWSAGATGGLYLAPTPVFHKSRNPPHQMAVRARSVAHIVV